MCEDIPLGLRFSLIHRFFRKQLDARLRELDLTGVQFGVLGELARMEHSGHGEVNQRDLENASHVTHPTMTEIIKRLEKKGFILCRQSQTDRRFKCISATDRALSLHKEMFEVDEEVFGRLSQGLSDEQKATLISLTDVMLSNIMDVYMEGCDDCVDKKACGKYKGI